MQKNGIEDATPVLEKSDNKTAVVKVCDFRRDCTSLDSGFSLIINIFQFSSPQIAQKVSRIKGAHYLNHTLTFEVLYDDVLDEDENDVTFEMSNLENYPKVRSEP